MNIIRRPINQESGKDSEPTILAPKEVLKMIRENFDLGARNYKTALNIKLLRKEHDSLIIEFESAQDKIESLANQEDKTGELKELLLELQLKAIELMRRLKFQHEIATGTYRAKSTHRTSGEKIN